MPIKRCGKSGYKWGNHGHCYPTREGALKQMRAIFHSGYTGASEKDDAEIEQFLDASEKEKLLISISESLNQHPEK